VHIGKRDASDQVIYHSFPRLVYFSDSDLLKIVALKLFKVLKPLLYTAGLTNDPAMMETPEQESYAHFFNETNIAYELVLVLKDGTRWKLDPHNHQNKKLNLAVDPEQVVRFECVVREEAALEPERVNFLTEIERELVPVSDKGLHELEHCFKKLV